MSDSIQVPQPNVPNESSLIRGSRMNQNSLINKSGQEKIEPKKLKGGVVKKTPSLGEKLKRSFIKEDLKDIRDYIIFDMIIPNARRAFFDTIVGTAAQIFGISVPRGGFYRSDGYSPANVRLSPHERQYRDFNSISRNASRVVDTRVSGYDRFYVSDYPFTYKEDAESVLEQLMDICDTYGWVSVATFFELSDPTGTIAGKNAYTNNNFGWHNIDGATVKFDGSGYIITLPPARTR